LVCGLKIPVWKRLDSKYCDEACKKTYYEYINGRMNVEKRIKKLVGVGHKEVDE
jgi:hypothetical protein